MDKGGLGIGRILEILAALIAIFVFITGYPYLRDFLNSISSSTAAHVSETIIDVGSEVWSKSITEPQKYETHILSERDLTNFSLESDVRFDSESPEYQGLVFRMQDGGFYSFRITPDGNLAFDRWYPNGSHSRILGPVAFDSIRTGRGQVNHLKVVANDQEFDLFVNGKKVGSLSDSAYSHGQAGLITCTCDGSTESGSTFSNVLLVKDP
jgi:hypothetical protein